MSSTRKVFFLCLLSLGIGLNLAAQSPSVNVIVTLNDNTEQTYLCDADSRLSFSGDDYLVITANGNSVHLPLADIRKVNFEEFLNVNESETADFQILPNPTRNVFTVKGIEGTQSMRIFSMDGRLMDSRSVNAGQSCDLNGIPSGLYIVNIGIHNLKLIKL